MTHDRRRSGVSSLYPERRIGILGSVPAPNWRESVASLLSEAGRALAAGQGKQARVALGTCMAYLEIAEKSGDALASDLLRQLSPRSNDELTERFQFAPGELEELDAENKRSAG
jgi:hypothetical protein